MDFVKQIKDRLQGKAPKGARRSSKWRKVRKAYLADHPRCELCETRGKAEVHHKIPFHLAPDLELDPDNLITLCENKKFGINCHLLVGHLGNYRRTNTVVDADVAVWRIKLDVDD